MNIRQEFKSHKIIIIGGGIFLMGITLACFGLVGINSYDKATRQAGEYRVSASDYQGQLTEAQTRLSSVSASLNALMAEDQRLRNNQLEAEIKAIEKEYEFAAKTYESLVDLRGDGVKTTKLDDQFAQILRLLSDRNWATASAKTKELAAAIKTEQEKAAAAFKIPENVPVNNTPPGAGYSRQQVQLDIGSYMVSIVSADLNASKVIVDTASEATCGNDCPVLALGDYVARSGAFAGINGPYFCPASYPQCADKKNSFDTLIMNKNKVYFNSDNNVYSTVPAVIFSGNGARFVGATQEWGRDTGVDSVIAAQPRLVAGGNAVFGGDGDPKKGSKSNRSFIGASGNTVYIGVVHNATVAEAARVIAAMGIKDALNLDAGGSTALWSGGYKVGPGRALPMGILLVRK